MDFFILSHPILIPFPETVADNKVDEIHEELLDKCTSNNPKNSNNNDQMKIILPTFSPTSLPTVTIGRILPVLMEKRRIGNPSTPVRRRNSKKMNNHDSHESESDVMEYCVYGTLLVTCLIILLLW